MSGMHHCGSGGTVAGIECGHFFGGGGGGGFRGEWRNFHSIFLHIPPETAIVIVDKILLRSTYYIYIRNVRLPEYQ